MKRFTNNQSVTVINPEHELVGKSGVVYHLLFRDHSAWVAMNDPVPDKWASFPIGDSRRDHVILWPEDCQ